MRIRIALLASTLALASGCGGDTTEPGPDETPVTPITEAGGIVTSTDGKATLIIPAGALAAPTTITISPATLSHPRLVPGTAYTFEPDGLTFAVPAKLTIRYDSVPATLADQSAFFWLHRREGNDWVPMEGERTDTLARLISGRINGFSQYGGATSTLADDVLQFGLQLSAMLTDATASVAIGLTTSIAALLQKSSDPAFQVLVEPVLQVAYGTACTAYSTALGIARDAPVTDYGDFTAALAPAYYWAGVIQTLGQGVPCAGSVGLLASMQDRKFQQFVDFYVARLLPAVIGANFTDLVAEIQFIFSLRDDVHELGLEAIEQRIEAEAQKPLMNAMRAAAYTACRDSGRHDFLGSLIFAAAGADFTIDQILDDLQYCATRVDWSIASADGTQNDNGSLGGALAPGSWVEEETAQGIATGTLTLGGSMRAFRCPDGSLDADQLVITLQGTEVHRQTATGGDFFSSPIQLDAATILSAAGIDPAASATIPLVLSRESPGCGAYVQTLGPVPLVTLQLGYPPPFGYFTDFENGAGSEWSDAQLMTAPSGEKHFGVFDNGSATLTLGNLPAHTEASIEFDFYALQSLDGNNTNFGPDIVEFRFAGGVVQRTTFTNVLDPAFTQAYPGDYPAASNGAGTGASATGSLGYPPNAGQLSDAVYHISFTRPHTGSTITFTVAGSGMDQWEGWGVDNVRVTVR